MSGPKDDDDAKRIILRRRAQFVAAALTGIVACEGGHENRPPEVCLSIAIPPPEPDAQAPIVVTDAGARAEEPPRDAGAPDVTEPPPMPCLSPPAPTVCLSPLPPPRDAGAAKKPPKKPPPMPCLSVAPYKEDDGDVK